MDRMFVPSGLEEVDLIFGGGFKRGSLIIVAGNPGTGKTVFSAGWLHQGAVEFNDPGVYVSFAEDREAFYDNMKGFGYDFERLEAEDSFSALAQAFEKPIDMRSFTHIVLSKILRKAGCTTLLIYPSKLRLHIEE